MFALCVVQRRSQPNHHRQGWYRIIKIRGMRAALASTRLLLSSALIPISLQSNAPCCSYASGRTAEAFQTYLEDAVTSDKGFARLPSLDEFASQFSTSKDLKTLLKDAQVSKQGMGRANLHSGPASGDPTAHAWLGGSQKVLAAAVCSVWSPRTADALLVCSKGISLSLSTWHSPCSVISWFCCFRRTWYTLYEPTRRQTHVIGLSSAQAVRCPDQGQDSAKQAKLCCAGSCREAD